MLTLTHFRGSTETFGLSLSSFYQSAHRDFHSHPPDTATSTTTQQSFLILYSYKTNSVAHLIYHYCY